MRTLSFSKDNLWYTHTLNTMKIKSDPDCSLRSEVLVAPSSDAPDTLDGGNSIVGYQYFSDGSRKWRILGAS